MFTFFHKAGTPFLLVLILFATLPLSESAGGKVSGQARRYFDETRTLIPPKGTVRVNNPTGNIRVTIADRADVQISASHSGTGGPVGNEEIILEELLNQLNIAATPAEGQPGINLEIEIPRNVYLRLFSETGSMEVIGKPAGLIATGVQGEIRLALPPDADAEISLSTVQGFSKCELPIKVQGTPNDRILHGQIGKGGTILVAETFRGNITITTGDSLPKGKRPLLENPNAPKRPPEVTTPDGETVVLESNLVLLNLSVSTRTGRPMSDLKEDNFEIYEDDVRQSVETFSPVTTPFNLVLLIDLSGSVSEKLNVIRRAAFSFLRAVRPEDKIAVVIFSDTARIVCPLTNDRQKLRERIDAIRKPGGGTFFYDALAGTLKAVLNDVRGERNAVVILSDGLDNSLPPGDPDRGSTTTYDELLAQVTESDAILFPIYLDTEAETIERYGQRAKLGYETSRARLHELADTTGGKFFKAKTIDDLEGRYEEVAAELRNVYSIGYSPSNTEKDGKYRKIRVKIVGRDGLVVRTRNGYYAPEK
jgi:Ca-activated chloride channel family protein